MPESLYFRWSCPHCGRTFSVLTDRLIPWHNVHPDDPGSEFVEKRSVVVAFIKEEERLKSGIRSREDGWR